MPPPLPQLPPRPDRFTWRALLPWPLMWVIVGVVILLALLVVWTLPVPDLIPAPQLVTGPTTTGRFEDYFWLVLIRPLSVAGVLPIMVGLLLVSALSGTMQLHRRRSASLVFGYLVSAVRLGLPLPVFLRTAARDESKFPRRRLNRMAAELESGRSISHALAGAAGELPPLVLDRVAAAEQSGTLSHALDLILERERRRLNEDRPGVQSRAYVAIVVTVLAMVTWMIMIFVLPKFAQIFQDFKVELPWTTRQLFNPVPAGVVGVLGLVTASSLVVLLTRSARGLFTSRPVPRTLVWLVDGVAWYTPVWGRMTRNRHAAVVCEALAEALIAGRPLPEAIDIATLPSLNFVLRRRMKQWADRVSAGETVAVAARASHMPPLLCDLLAGAPTDPTNALIFAGRAYRSASGRLAAVLAAVAPVVITGILAAFVLFLSLALFTPMITLIDSISVVPRRP